MIKCLFDPQNHHFASWVWIFNPMTYRSLDSEAPSRPKAAPLHYDAHHGFHRVVEWLITTCSQDVNNVSGYRASTPLHVASEYGWSEVMQVLLKHHADVNRGNVNAWIPLHVALCNYGHEPEIARLLLKHGANVDRKTKRCSTALYLLLRFDGNQEVARMLLERGADPNIRNCDGENALYAALGNGHPCLIQLLLKHGMSMAILFHTWPSGEWT